MKIFDKTDKIEELIEENPMLILAFERMGVTLGVNEKTIEEVAQELKLNPEMMITLLNMQQDKDFQPNYEFEIEDSHLIVNYLKQSHNYFSSEVYPRIKKNIDELVAKNKKIGVKMIDNFFKEYCNEVDIHFDYENSIVFPYILSLSQNEQQDQTSENKYSVNEYKQHHENIEEKLEDLKHLLIKFLPYDNDSQVRRNILLDLFHLEKDLLIHSRIENELLIPLVERNEHKIKQL